MHSVPTRLLSLRSGFPNLPEKPQPSHLVLLSAEDVETLRAQAMTVRTRLAEAGSLHSLSIMSDDHRHAQRSGHRLAVIGASATEIIGRIDLALQKLSGPGRERFQAKGAVFYGSLPVTAPGSAGLGRTRQNVFLFPGQGSQVEGMLDELCVLFPAVRSWIEDLDAELADVPVIAPSVLAYPPLRDLSDDERAAIAFERIDLQCGAQLGVVANLALSDLLMDLGIRPDLVVGHSNGEHAAIFTSGIRPLDRRGLLGLCRRFSEMALGMAPPAAPEAVAAVSLADRDTLEAIVRRHDDLYLSMINCPTQFVVAGTADAVRAASAALASAGALVQAMPFRRAYHTPLFGAWSERLSALYAGGEVVEPRIPIYSCWTAGRFPSDGDAVRRCVAQQLSHRVDFHATAEQIYADGGRRFIEVGPGSALTGFINDSFRDRDHLAVPMSRGGQPALLDLQRALARLFVDGVDLDFSSRTWQSLEAAGFAVALAPRAASTAPVPVQTEAPPSADFAAEVVRRHFAVMNEFLAGQRRMIDLVLGSLTAPEPATALPWPLLGVVTDRQPTSIETRRHFTAETDPILGEHSLGPHLQVQPQGTAPLAIIPFTFSMEIAAEAALQLFGGGAVTSMRGIRGFRWLALDCGSLNLAIRAEIRSTTPPVAVVRLFEIADEGRLLAFEAEVEVASALAPDPGTAPLARGVPARRPTWSAAQFYRDFAFHGPAFQAVQSVEGVDTERIVARLEVPFPPRSGGGPWIQARHLDPGFMDAAGQLVGLWLLEQGKEHFGIFPFHLRSFEQLRPLPSPGSAVRAEAMVRWLAPGVTQADIEFWDDRGVIYRLGGFEQRYLPLPVSLVTTLMGGWSADPEKVRPRERFLSIPGASSSERVIHLPEKLLEESWGIWRRAIAHHLLSRDELEKWYRTEHRDTGWLLGRAAAKETVRQSMAGRGLRVESLELSVSGPAAGELTVSGPRLETPAIVSVERVGEATVATLLASTLARAGLVPV